MIEFFKLKSNPDVIVIREKGARGPAKETRIILDGDTHETDFGPITIRLRALPKRKNARRK